MNGQNLVKMAILCLRRMHAMLKIGKMGLSELYLMAVTIKRVKMIVYLFTKNL